MPRHPAARPTRRLAPRRLAFTLVELLVVMAVITILAAIVMPVTVNSLRSAAAANCTSNLKQVHFAMMAYAHDQGLFIVPLNTASPNLGWDPPRKWYELLEPYTRESGIWQCRAKSRTAVGYSQNHRVFYGPGSGQSDLNLWVAPQPLTLANNPSGSVLFLDAGWVINIHDDPDDWREDDRKPGCCRFPIDNVHGAKTYVWWETSPQRPVPRHPGGKTNCAFIDGHVAAVRTRDLVDDDYYDPGCLYDNQ